MKQYTNNNQSIFTEEKILLYGIVSTILSLCEDSIIGWTLMAGKVVLITYLKRPLAFDK